MRTFARARRRERADGRDTAEGLAQLEGYLLARSEERAARTDGEAFAARMPWLTTSQHEEVVRLYADDRLALSRRVLEHITHRCHELRSEYTERYEQLRWRVWRAAVALVLATLAVCCALLWLVDTR